MMNSDYAALLRQYRLKPSHQRIAILRYMHENRIHPSVDDIYDALHDDIPTLSKTTVYNTLSGFIKSGLVMPMYAGAHARYDLAIDDHAHFICISCGAIEDIDAQHTDKGLKGRTVLSRHVTYRGYCAKCAGKSDVDRRK